MTEQSPNWPAVLSQREVAEMLGISPQAVAQAEQKAFNKMREELLTEAADLGLIRERTGME